MASLKSRPERGDCIADAETFRRRHGEREAIGDRRLRLARGSLGLGALRIELRLLEALGGRGERDTVESLALRVDGRVLKVGLTGEKQASASKKM